MGSKKRVEIHKGASLKGVTYRVGDHVLSTTLPGDWQGHMRSRLRARHLEDPARRDSAIAEREASGKPATDDLMHSFGKVVADPKKLQPDSIEHHAHFRNMPHLKVERLHRVFSDSPERIDFRKFTGTPEEQRRDFLQEFEHLKEKGIEFLRSYPPAEGYFPGKGIVAVRARVRMGEAHKPEVVELLYERGEGGVHELVAVDFDLGPVRSRQVYTVEQFKLFEHSKANALSDIEKRG